MPLPRSLHLVIVLSLAACGRDEILEQAETSGASAGAGTAGSASGAAPSTGGVGGGARGAAPQAPGIPQEPVPGRPGEPSPGVAAVPTPSAPGAGLAGAPAPGIPDPPKPGIPTEPAPGQPGQAQGPTVAVTGTIVYAAYDAARGGDIKITAFDADHSIRGGKPPRVVAMAVAKRPGPFTLQAPVGVGKLYVEAAIDEDGDGRPGPLDPQGQADRFPITVKDAAIDGVEIALRKREPPPRK
jgi:hypothetical protein